jgi:alpha-beta hydrolase superfamily lysophospholipase
VRALGVLVAVAVVAGCGSHKEQHALPHAPSLSSTCGSVADGLHSAARWVRTSDGVRLYTAFAGKGSTTVVLAHESPPADLCGWLPTIAWLESRGVATVAFDFRGSGRSDSPDMPKYLRYAPDLQAEVDAARDHGASRIVLMGASFGGAAVLANGSRLHGVDAIVSLSGEQRIEARRLDAMAALPKLRTPLLVVASRDDRYLDAAAARQLMARAGSKRKQLSLWPGAVHGWDLIENPRVRAVVLRCIR